jgi:hypothetical protein
MVSSSGKWSHGVVPWLWLKLLRQRFDARGLHLIVKAAAAVAAKFV